MTEDTYSLNASETKSPTELRNDVSFLVFISLLLNAREIETFLFSSASTGKEQKLFYKNLILKLSF